METKQVIVFRKDLLKGEHAIRKGKFAAQVAHASMGALLKWFTKERCEYLMMGPYGEAEPQQFFTRYSLEFKDGTLLDSWLNGAFTKVVVSVEGEKELLELEKELQRLNEQESKLIPYALITDIGKTEFHGEQTVTCLGIGPYFSEELDKITGKLPLL